MFDFFDPLSVWVPKYMMIFARISGMMATLPILSYPVISRKIRFFIILVFTLVLFPIIGSTAPEMFSWVQLVVAILKEVLIGLIIGFGARVIFEALNMSGSFIGRQMGLGIANVMDPTSQQQLPIISQFWFLLITVFFLVTNGHHLFLETMFKNFTILPLGSGTFAPATGRTIVQTGTFAFAIALKMAAPAMVFLLLVDTAIAFTAKVMPQMNIFIVSMPLKIGVGLFLVVISIDIFQIVFQVIYDNMVIYFNSVTTQMSKV